MPGPVREKLVAASLEAVRSDEFRDFAVAHGYIVDSKGPEEMRAELNFYQEKFADLLKFLEKK